MDDQDVPRSWDQTQTLNGGLVWTQGPWQASIAAQYHTGWPVTPVEVMPQSNALALGPRNSARYGGFTTVDARVSRTWMLARGSLELHAEATNATDHRNPCCTDQEYFYDDTGTLHLRQELQHWLPLVPSVGVLWRF
jgi:hypothetical protein